jgi:hypothetical protein
MAIKAIQFSTVSGPSEGLGSKTLSPTSGSRRVHPCLPVNWLIAAFRRQFGDGFDWSPTNAKPFISERQRLNPTDRGSLFASD